MSAIDELKKGSAIEIDLGDSEEDDGGIMIDTSDDSSVDRVDLSSLNPRRGNHQVVRPKPSNNKPGSPNRKSVSIDALPTKPEEQTEDVHVSPIDDLIGVDNPNSMFSKYVQHKEDEAREWIAEKEEEKAVLAEEGDEISIDASSDDSFDESDYVSTSSNTNIRMEDDLDISGLLNKEETSEEEKMSEEVLQDTTEEEDIDSLIDTTDLEEPEDKVTEETEATVEEKEDDETDVSSAADSTIDNAKTDGAVIGKIEEPTSYDAPDLEVEESVQTFTKEIVEDEDESTAVADTDDDEVLKHLQKLATERLKPVSKQLDISSFTILKKPVTNVAPIFQESSARVIKWVLPSQESIVLMKEFSGSELEKLREYSENSRSVDSLNRRFHMIYDHIVSPKPATFEAWLKSTPYEDIDHYFFAIYVACFKGANYLPADCPNKNCGETFLTEDVNIMDMVKFDTEEAKNKFAELYQSEATPAGKGVYCTEVVPMNNKIAIAFRQPSIYNVLEIASLDDKSRKNYSNIIDYIPYIDTIYAMDIAAQTLTPITYKMFPDNNSRTIRSKIQKYDSLFNALSVDEFGPIKAYIRAITEKTTGMHYVYPAVECPKCHTSTTEQTVSAEELVFTRYQLGGLVNTLLS